MFSLIAALLSHSLGYDTIIQDFVQEKASKMCTCLFTKNSLVSNYNQLKHVSHFMG